MVILPAAMDFACGRLVDSVDTLEQVVVLGLVTDSVDAQDGLVVRLIPPGGATRDLRRSGLRVRICLTGCGRVLARGSRLRPRNESRPSCEACTVSGSDEHRVKKCVLGLGDTSMFGQIGSNTLSVCLAGRST